MEQTRNGTGWKAGVTLAYVLMVGVNSLANIIPLNGITTGEVSDNYSNLFAPAGLTFSIWSVIYLLLLGFVLYQWGLFRNDAADSEPVGELVSSVRGPFIVTCLANAAWLFAWHYDFIGVSTIFMLVLLGTLIGISNRLAHRSFDFRNYFFLRLPFSIYFGWITIATIANVTTMLVSWGWNGFGLTEDTWTVIILIVGVLIGLATMLRNRDFAYGLVILWGYFGILMKHQSPDGWNAQFSNIILTLYISLAIVAAVGIYVLYRQIKEEA